MRGGDPINEGDVISIDGTTGEVFLGAVPVVDSSVVRYFEGEQVDEDLVEAVDGVMRHADSVRRLRVRANADTPEDAGALAGSAPRASGCAAPSTCSSATDASSWRT